MEEFRPLAVVGTTLVACAIAIRVGRLPLTPKAVLASAPWAITGGVVVVVARRLGVYEGIPFVSVPLLLSFLTLAAVGIWFGTTEFADLRTQGFSERYLAASGLIAAAVLTAALFTHVDVVIERVVWVTLTAVAAVAVAAVGYFCLGLFYTDALVELRSAGFYTVAAVAFDGLATATAVLVLGAGGFGVVSAGVLTAASAVGIGLPVKVVAALTTVAGVGIAGIGGWLTRRYGWVGILGLLVVSAFALGSGVVVVLSAVFLG